MLDYGVKAATLGDDVYGEPSTMYVLSFASCIHVLCPASALEAHVAALTGKEAGLFMPSGTASNQLALRTHLYQPPYTILCDHRAHIHKFVSNLHVSLLHCSYLGDFRYEAGGAAYHSGAAITPVIPANGISSLLGIVHNPNAFQENT